MTTGIQGYLYIKSKKNPNCKLFLGRHIRIRRLFKRLLRLNKRLFSRKRLNKRLIQSINVYFDQ